VRYRVLTMKSCHASESMGNPVMVNSAVNFVRIIDVKLRSTAPSNRHPSPNT